MAVSTIKNKGLLVQKFTASVSVAGNTNTNVAIPYTEPTGYKAVAVVGVDLGTQMVTAFNWNLNTNNRAFIAVRSNRSDAITLTMGAYILFEPN